MSDERSECPYCAGHKIAWDHEMNAIGKCSVHGTGRNTARAGVTCTSLVGAWKRRVDAARSLQACASTKEGARLYQTQVLVLSQCIDEAEAAFAPTVRDHLSRKAGTPGVEERRAE